MGDREPLGGGVEARADDDRRPFVRMHKREGHKCSPRWSADELDILMAHIGDHGAEWPGWEELLPGRTPDAIKARARRPVVPCAPRQREPAVAHDPASDARAVMRLLRRGMTPSEADREIGLAPGTARDLAVRAWKLGVL